MLGAFCVSKWMRSPSFSLSLIRTLVTFSNDIPSCWQSTKPPDLVREAKQLDSLFRHEKYNHGLPLQQHSNRRFEFIQMSGSMPLGLYQTWGTPNHRMQHQNETRLYDTWLDFPFLEAFPNRCGLDPDAPFVNLSVGRFTVPNSIMTCCPTLRHTPKHSLPQTHPPPRLGIQAINEKGSDFTGGRSGALKHGDSPRFFRVLRGKNLRVA